MKKEDNQEAGTQHFCFLIEKELLKKAKVKAILEDKTTGEVIVEAIRKFV